MRENFRNLKENTRDYVYRVIKENIMYLELKPGQNVSESEFCELLGVSRTPVREALVKLGEEKLIDVYPQRGTFVSKIDLSIVEEAFFLRSMVEKEILKSSMETFNDSHLKLLEKNLYMQKGNAELGGETREKFDLDNQFHEIIYKVNGKSRIWGAIKLLSTHYDRLRFLDAMEGSSVTKTLEQHQYIYEIIKSKNDAVINNVVTEHLANYKDKIEYFKNKYKEYFL